MRPATWCVLPAVSTWFIASLAFAAGPVLEIRGTVVLPGNQPAAKARLSLKANREPQVEVEANEQGEFSLIGRFLQNATVIARSADNLFQDEFIVIAPEARTRFTKPLHVELRPARRVTVELTHDGQPAPNAQVGIAGRPIRPEISDERGQLALLVPDESGTLDISAWHPELGVAAGEVALVAEDGADVAIKLALNPPQRANIRVVDHEGKPVSGTRLIPSFGLVDGQWFSGDCIPSLRQLTDATGQVELPWAPKLVKTWDADLVDEDWLLDDVDQSKDGGPPVMHVRKKRAIQGKLAVPPGCDPAGLLIAGHSFGPGNRMDITATRCSADGSFLLQLAPEHCYVLAVCDTQWASDPIVGVFARSDSDEITPLPELKLYPGTPLEIRATIGPQQMPLRNTFVQISRPVDSEWRDAANKLRRGNHAVAHWFKTDPDGYIRTGIGRGKYEVSIFHEKWQREETLAVDSERPLSLSLHKPYEGRREIKGKVLRKMNTGGGFETVKVVAVQRDQHEGAATDVEVDAMGRFVYSTDSPRVMFFALDTAASACGTAVAVDADSQVSIELQPAATYEGRLVDAQGEKLANAVLSLKIESAPGVFASQVVTDASANFRFGNVFAGVPLRFSLITGGRTQPLAEHFFEPGEQRIGIRVRSAATNRRDEVVHRLLHDRVKLAARDARLAGMHVLVVIAGNGDAAQQFVQKSVLNYDDNPLVFEYLIVSLTAADVRGHAGDLAYAQRERWPLPEDKQVTLAVIDGQGKSLAQTQIAADASNSSREVTEFLARHKPVLPGAEQLWQATLAEAKKTDRRVLLQFGGPRCGPCFLFGRWLDDHHKELDGDYVMLKLHSGRHSGAAELEERLRGKAGSIPWTGILNADGRLLATSDGPLGNIGFPGEYESIRHFRRMLDQTAQRLSAEDIAALVRTLEE